MPIAIAELLNPEQVMLNISAPNETEALRQSVECLRGNSAVRDLQTFSEELLARERLQSTAAGNGIAFPHARTDVVESIVLAIARSSEGVPFGEDRRMVHLMFIVGTPKRLVRDYLVCIGALARVSRDPAVRAALLDAQEPEQFLDVLRAALGESL